MKDDDKEVDDFEEVGENQRGYRGPNIVHQKSVKYHILFSQSYLEIGRFLNALAKHLAVAQRHRLIPV